MVESVWIVSKVCQVRRFAALRNPRLGLAVTVSGMIQTQHLIRHGLVTFWSLALPSPVRRSLRMTTSAICYLLFVIPRSGSASPYQDLLFAICYLSSLCSGPAYPFLNSSSSPFASAWIVSPAANLPSNTARLSGSNNRRWITRFNGRAP
jgi:hypothetical protein